MRIVALDDVAPLPRRVAVGTFDGVHLGHREVIRGADTVLTFDPHPATVVHPGSAPKLLTSLARKAELIAGLGVRELVIIPFDPAFASRSAQDFVDDVLVGRLGATHVRVGENFRFGHHAQGTPELLARDERFATTIVRLLEVSGEVVSSSRIRALLAAGDVAAAAALLGAPFAVAGEVVHGDKRGRELGYPTANLVPDPAYAIPGHGVYATLANGIPAATNIGVRPTFVTGRGELIEAFLIDWSGDLYGTRLELTFVERLRGERRFDSVEELVEQMARDVQETRARLLPSSAA